MVEPLQVSGQYGEACPAGWRPGQRGRKADGKGVADCLAENATSL